MKLNVMNTYDIMIEKSILQQCSHHISKVARGTKCAVISDSNVMPLYGKTVTDSLKKGGFETFAFTFPAGEKSKNINTLLDMVNFLAQNGLTRSDTVIALGGGVTGDMAGFAASIYLRGIDFVQIPTTLLSQIDSSVGGKTACDLALGKNLVGAFYNPRLVLIDPDTLSTLPDEFMIDGMGEAVKYGCIQSKSLFERLENTDTFSWIDEMIYECVKIKAAVVERDFKEQGERALLNFGHTLGHAIEKLQNFRGISHGCAVSIGMNLVAASCEKKGICPAGTHARIKALCEKYHLPTDTELDIKDICSAAYHDKKRNSDKLNLIAIKEIGDCFVMSIVYDDLYRFIKE